LAVLKGSGLAQVNLASPENVCSQLFVFDLHTNNHATAWSLSTALCGLIPE